MKRVKSTALLLAALGLSSVRADAQIYPERGLNDSSTGLVETRIGRDWYRGSGVITRDPRLVYSCAHMIHEDGVWAAECLFHRAWHSASEPGTGSGVAARGFHYFTGYAPAARGNGGESDNAYQNDFAIFYNGAGYGAAVGWWPDGGSVLRSNQWKFIAGYPSRISRTRANGFFYQHATGWFDNSAMQVRGAYHQIDGVSTGAGNSGGPVFVWDDTSKEYYLAAVLVSGDSDLSGVRALDDAANNMASAALGSRETTRTYVNTRRTRLPDGAGAYTSRTIAAAGFDGKVGALKCSVHISTPRRGDLEVFLRSPSGRIRWIHKPSSSTRDNLTLASADFTSTFRGYAANGTWSLRMRDVRSPNRAQFNRFSLSITGPGK